MSHNIDSIKISCLLYLDRPIQADLSDFLSDLTPSRKGEVLREILENGWKKYKEENGVGLDPDEIAQLIFDNNKKKVTKTKAKKGTRKVPPVSNPSKKNKEREKDNYESESAESEVSMDEEDKSGISIENEESQNELVQDDAPTRPFLSNVKSFSIDDLEEDDEDNESPVDPLSVMKQKHS